MYFFLKNHFRAIIKLGYKKYINIGQISEFVIAITNTNVHTYSVSPALAVIETICIREVGKIAGYDKATVDGTVVPGGTYANMLGLLVARNWKFPHVRMEGWLTEDRPVVFTSVQAHYSIRRAAMIAGMGIKSCREVKAGLDGNFLFLIIIYIYILKLQK
jgi:glutamate/tyrosine decarboxylase-like PLP-dependent enzyme